MVFYKGSTRPSAFNGETVAGFFRTGIFVCRADEGDQKVLDGIEELWKLVQKR